MSRHQKRRQGQAPRRPVADGAQAPAPAPKAVPAPTQGQVARGDDGEAFEQIRARLDDIVSEVRGKDVSLERSLDLLDEAVKLGSRAVELVDTTALSDSEKQRLATDDLGQGDDAPAPASDAPADAVARQDGDPAMGAPAPEGD